MERKTEGVEYIAFLIRSLRNSAATLSLACENAKKHTRDEKFLMDLFDAACGEVKRMNGVIQACSHIAYGNKTSVDKAES
jgi:transposase-like protein